jgi:hypothetical protein
MSGLYKNKEVALKNKSLIHSDIRSSSYLTSLKRVQKDAIGNDYIFRNDEKNINKTDTSIKKVEPIKLQEEKIINNTSEILENDISPTIDYLEEIVNPSKQTFVEKFNNAPLTYYTITLGLVKEEKIDDFIKKYISSTNYKAYKRRGLVQVMYGLYSTRKEALEGIKKVHKDIQISAYITSMKSLRK